MGITEIFSILLERFSRNRTYLRKKIGITDDKNLDEIIELNKFRNVLCSFLFC